MFLKEGRTKKTQSKPIWTLREHTGNLELRGMTLLAALPKYMSYIYSTVVAFSQIRYPIKIAELGY